MSLFRGFSFPFRKSGDQLPAQSLDEELVAESVHQIVLTAKGERVMRPGVGTNATNYVFDNNDLVLQENLRTDTMNALTRYEPRIIVLSIDMIRDIDEGRLTLDIVYVIRATQQAKRLHVPIAEV